MNEKIILITLIGIAAVALFTTFVVYRPCGDVARAHHVRVGADLHTLGNYLETYRSLKGSYPTATEGLRVLNLRETPTDPWSTEYVYRCPGEHAPQAYDLFSAGPDRVANTADYDWCGSE